MERSDVWAAIDEHRRPLVRLLEGLSEEEWDRPSLCDGWTIRQVAARSTRWRAVMPSFPFRSLSARDPRPNRVWRPLPSVTFRETAIDYLVHGQDIAVPLGRSLEMPRDLAAVAADRVWSRHRMFHARKKLAVYRLVADDARWAAGQGHEVCGPIGALLLLLTGRAAALPQLSGSGAVGLRMLLAPSSAD
jgi:hypothetical protein